MFLESSELWVVDYGILPACYEARTARPSVQTTRPVARCRSKMLDSELRMVRTTFFSKDPIDAVARPVL